MGFLRRKTAEDIVLSKSFIAIWTYPVSKDKDSQTGEPTGIKLPYVVTVDEGSGQVLAIYRNYREDDPLRKKIQYFVHYKFLPGLGFYGFGLIHMLGGLSRTATSALRQLIDAGTLSNLPAGFKARGLRVRDDDQPLQPRRVPGCRCTGRRDPRILDVDTLQRTKCNSFSTTRFCC